MNNNYKGYSLFNDVEDAALRTWNRCVVISNGNVDLDKDFVKDYANHLTKVDRMQMYAMLNYIKVKGADIVRQEINNNKHTKELTVSEVVH